MCALTLLLSVGHGVLLLLKTKGENKKLLIISDSYLTITERVEGKRLHLKK